MRLVIDSNVYVSGMTVEGLSHEVLALAFGEHEVFVTDEILCEAEKAFRKKFKEPDDLVKSKVAFIKANTQLIEITGKLRTQSRDPKDDHVLEAASVADAQVIVTGDKDLLTLMKFGGAEILSPRGWLERWG